MTAGAATTDPANGVRHPAPVAAKATWSPARRRIGLALALALVAAAFAGGLRGGFVYDDLLLVVRNPWLADPARLGELVSGGLWDFLDTQSAARIGYWRPLTSLALALGMQLGDGSPLAFHLLSLGVHLAATVAAGALARRITRDDAIGLGVALLFGLHPVHVEAVSWISAVNDPLWGLFGLWALERWLAWRERGSRGIAWAPATLALCAVLSKEQGVAVLPAVLGLDLALRRLRPHAADEGIGDEDPVSPARAQPLAASFAPIARGYGVLAAAFALWYLARALVFGDPLAGFDRTVTEFGVVAARLFALRLEVLGGSLWLLLWPFELQLFRPFVPDFSLVDLGTARAFLCLALWLAAVAWLWRRTSDGPLLAALLSTPCLLLPVVARIEALGLFPLSERFLYAPVFGWVLFVAIVLRRSLPAKLAWTALWLLALAYGWRTATRTGFWKDELTIFEAEAAASPRSPYVRWGLGRVLLGRYRETRDLALLRRAHDEFQEGLDLLAAAQFGDGSIFATRDDHVQTNLGLATVLLYEAEVSEYHDYEAAIEVFEQVVRVYPESEVAHTGLAIALLAVDRRVEAENALRKALAVNPRHAEAHHALGVLAMRSGDFAGAILAFESSLEWRPGHLETLLLLAGAHDARGETARAEEITDRAALGDPDDPRPVVLQAKLAAKRQDFQRATGLVARAIELDRLHGEAWLVKGQIHFARGERAAAETSFVRASELDTLSFDAHYNAAGLLLQDGRRSQALPYLVRAYEVRTAGESGDRVHEILLSYGIEEPGLLRQLAAADSARGFDEQALGWIERWIAAAPRDVLAQFLAGRAEKRLGRHDAAVASFERVLEIAPDHFAAHHELGILLIELGRREEGVRHLQRALEIARQAGDDPSARAAIEGLQEAIDKASR